jgi:hypothetical protein
MDIEAIFGVTSYLVWTVIIVSLADLVSGLVHWFEDSYGQESWPLIGSAIITPNRLHHAKPRAFVQNNWWESCGHSLIVGVGVVLAALWGGWLSWGLMLLLVVAINGNEVHKWAHRTPAENGRLISWLQARGLVQNRRQHARHHRGLRNSHYCIITTWVNPVVDKLGGWRFLEQCVYQTTGIRPVQES